MNPVDDVLDVANVLIRDLNGRIRVWSAGAAQLYGFTKEEAIGQVAHILLKTTFPRPAEEIKNIVLSDGRWTGELVHTHKAGHRLTVASLMALYTKSGTPEIVEVNNDITDYNRLRTTLNLLVEHAPVPIALLDKELCYLAVSRRWLNDFFPAQDVKAADIIGKPHFEVFPGLPDRWRQAIYKALAGEVLSSDEDHIERADGQVYWMRWEKRPWYCGTGEIGGVIMFSEEITIRKRAEEQLREQDRRKDEFIAMLSHELRNPLAPILTSLTVLRNGLDTQRHLDIIERQALHLTRLVDDLLDVARITTGQLEMRKKDIVLQHVIRNALETLYLAAENKKLTLKVRIPANPVLIHADGTRLQQVFLNLVGNALKYTLPGGLIALTVVAADQSVQISVKDNGPGIPREAQPHIFDLFVQAQKVLDHPKENGMGIGLSLVRHIVVAHGGTIVVKSKPGEGSEFIVNLPLPPTHLLPTQESG